MNTPTNGELIAADAAKSLGLRLSASGLANLAAQIDVLGKIEAGSPVTIEDVSVVDWMAAQVAASPSWTLSEKTNTTNTTTNAAPPLTETMTARALRINGERRLGGAKTAAAEKLVADHGNPFMPGQKFNRARAGFVQNHAPELAERLRAEASL